MSISPDTRLGIVNLPPFLSLRKEAMGVRVFGES